MSGLHLLRVASFSKHTIMEEEPARVAEAEFFGVRVPEGEKVVVGVAEDDYEMHFETYHLTQARTPAVFCMHGAATLLPPLRHRRSPAKPPQPGVHSSSELHGRVCDACAPVAHHCSC